MGQCRDMARPRTPLRLLAPALVVLLGGLVLAACSGDDDGGAPAATTPPTTAAPTTVAPTTAPTTVPPAPVAELTEEVAVAAAYRQGLARVDDGWIFSTRLSLYRVDESLARTVENLEAIPADLAAQGYDHIGDVDVADGVLYVPLEQPDYALGEQLLLQYDAATLEPLDTPPLALPLAHFAFVAVDDGVVWTMSDFDDDDTVLRFDLESGEALEPIVLSRRLQRVQGGDVADGFLWLSADDEGDGLYRVDPASGTVDRIGALSRPDGEGEGIDATDLPSGQLHAVSVDVDVAPVWFQHFALRPAGG